MGKKVKMPKLNGVFETALYVEELERSVFFYETLFGFDTLFRDERLCALNVSNKQVLLLFLEGGSKTPVVASCGFIPPHDGSGQLHVAFSIAATDLEEWECWLRDKGIAIESRVMWPRGGTSIYFRDPDEHLLELVTPGLWTIY